jgi:hypothetical protein
MLRITTAYVLTFRLEGRLEGPWVTLLANCWRNELARSHGKRPRVDLNGVTFISADGKACLARMHKQGAEFIACDPMTKAMVAEIVGESC